MLEWRCPFFFRNFEGSKYDTFRNSNIMRQIFEFGRKTEVPYIDDYLVKD